MCTTNRNEEETDATNELINDDEFVQPLTLDEIEALKNSGVHASVRPRPYLSREYCIITLFAGNNKGTD